MAVRPLHWLVTELGRAVRDAQAAVDEHALGQFHALVHQPAEGGARPRHLQVPVPRASGGYEVRDIPAAALVHHSHLSLEEVRVTLHASLLHDEDTDALAVRLEPAAPATPAAGPAAPPPAGSPGTLSFTFRHGAAPEGRARLATHYHQQI